MPDGYAIEATPDRSKWDRRADGSRKGDGWLGVLKRRDGRVSSEISVGVEIEGQETEIPLIVPTLKPQELRYLMENDPRNPDFQKRLPPSIMDKAVTFARRRLSQGKSPFRGEREEVEARDRY